MIVNTSETTPLGISREKSAAIRNVQPIGLIG